MNTLSYKQAYDKIIEAYFKDEIRPFDSEFCFCGNLNDRNMNWDSEYDTKRYYTGQQYRKMELALFSGMEEIYPSSCNGDWCIIKNTPVGEEALFNGMSKALDVLKEIHRSRGENVDEEPTPFTKRKLQNTTI